MTNPLSSCPLSQRVCRKYSTDVITPVVPRPNNMGTRLDYA